LRWWTDGAGARFAAGQVEHSAQEGKLSVGGPRPWDRCITEKSKR
jgi:hypothetical protein